MALNQVVSKRADLSQLDYTYDLLSSLSDDELEAVQKVAIVFLNRKKEAVGSDLVIHFQPQTEEQLFERIDHSIAQIDPDTCEDLDDVADQMMSEISK